MFRLISNSKMKIERGAFTITIYTYSYNLLPVYFSMFGAGILYFSGVLDKSTLYFVEAIGLSSELVEPINQISLLSICLYFFQNSFYKYKVKATPEYVKIIQTYPIRANKEETYCTNEIKSFSLGQPDPNNSSLDFSAKLRTTFPGTVKMKTTSGAKTLTAERSLNYENAYEIKHILEMRTGIHIVECFA